MNIFNGTIEMIKQNYKKPRLKIQHKTGTHSPSEIWATSGDSKGDINLFWEPVKDANTYVIQRSALRKGNLRWQYVDIIDKSNYTVTGLKSGTKYCFRFAAITSKGQCPWSGTIQKKAP